MRWLAVDTAGEIGSVALAQWDDGGRMTLLGSMDLPTRSFSARLLPAISEVLQQNHIALAAVEGFVVVRGPGSFTGLRVGLSAVKGLAEATDKPVIAPSRLAVMSSMQPEASQVHALLDAGRGEFYYGMYRDAGWECAQESLETATTLRAIFADEKSVPRSGGCIVAEGAVAAALTLLEQRAVVVVHATAADVFPLAWRYRQQQRFADVALLDANYLRRSDAELFARIPAQAAQGPNK